MLISAVVFPQAALPLSLDVSFVLPLGSDELTSVWLCVIETSASRSISNQSAPKPLDSLETAGSVPKLQKFSYII